MRPVLLDRRSSQAGYTLIELLVSTAIMVTVTGAIFSLMNPAQGNAQTQPEVADMQQRMRVGNETLFKELMMAGAGPYQGSQTGSLVRFFAPILPRRIGRVNPDLPTTFRDDAITLSYIPNSYSQTTISASMPNVSAELKVTNQSNCPADAGNLCGFTEGMDVIIFDTSGNFDMFTITQVQDAAAHLQHRGQDLSKPYDIGASVTQIVSNTFYLNRQTNQLMRYNGGTNDVPLVDNVVDLKFQYFGDPNPPLAPQPLIGSGEENCLYDALGNPKPLPTLNADEGSLAMLPGAMLVDGPMCGGGSNQYDADLLRIRKVRITMRVQAADPSLRGADTALFKHPGTSRGGQKFVPDYNISFEVSPRNLNLTR
jgi:prepilin-type N-terminal cleavage/methylation domain-containing protein